MIHKVTFEAFIAGAILKFGRVDSIDMFILIMMANKHNLELVSGKVGVLNRFIDYSSTSITLKDGFNLESLVEGRTFTLEEQLKTLSGNNILEFISNIDLKEFMLRKIEMFNGTAPIRLCSNRLEELALEELVSDYYVIKIFDADEDVYILTKKGHVYLFKKDNAVALEVFKNVLEVNNYNGEALDIYLEIQNLNKKPWEILNLDEFQMYCRDYSIDLEGTAR